jgi:hypothetical protein
VVDHNETAPSQDAKRSRDHVRRMLQWPSENQHTTREAEAARSVEGSSRWIEKATAPEAPATSSLPPFHSHPLSRRSFSNCRASFCACPAPLEAHPLQRAPAALSPATARPRARDRQPPRSDRIPPELLSLGRALQSHAHAPQPTRRGPAPEQVDAVDGLFWSPGDRAVHPKPANFTSQCIVIQEGALHRPNRMLAIRLKQSTRRRIGHVLHRLQQVELLILREVLVIVPLDFSNLPARDHLGQQSCD